MKKTGTIVFLFAVALGCSPQLRIFTDQAPDADPASYVTYDWKVKTDIEAGRHPLFYNELNDQRIRNAVNMELQKKGYVLRETEPELILHYHIVIQDHPYVSIPYDYDYANFDYWVNRHSLSSYKEGTMIIDFMDAKSNNLIWRGWAMAVLDEVNPSRQTEELIRKSVTRILSEFPVCRGRTQENNPLSRSARNHSIN